MSVCLAWRLDGRSTYCVDGQIYSAGAAVSWLQRLGLVVDVAELDRLAPDEPEDVIFAPALAGLGAPRWAPEAGGAWVGLSLDTSREELVRAALWGIAAQVAILGRAIEADTGVPLARLRVDGGLARSKLLMQAQADLLQVPVELYPSADATARGVGALARLGLRCRPDLLRCRRLLAAERRVRAPHVRRRGRGARGAPLGPVRLDRRARPQPRAGRVSPAATEYDAVVIGAGDVGTALARELARFELRIALVEAGGDIGAGTSKANTAILHTGFDAKPGTLEARLVARGHDLLTAYAAEVGIPLERTGALLVAWNEQQLARFAEIRDTARRNGYDHVRDVGQDEVYGLEPHLGPGALAALHVPDEHIVCPWTPPLACATQAVLAGVELRCGEQVTGLTRRPEGGWRVTTPRAAFGARWVLNAAGLFSDEIHRMAGYEGFHIVPRRGELIVFDKLTRPLVSHVLLPVPTGATKGVLVAPTVFGNVMLGPTAVDVENKRATATTVDGLSSLWSHGSGSCPSYWSTKSRPRTPACGPQPSTPTTSSWSTVTPAAATRVRAASARPV